MSPTTTEEFQAAEAAFLNKVWTDETFWSRLESDPRSVLSEMGSELPDGIEIRVVRDTDVARYLHIPAAPPEGEISDTDLIEAQGGTTPWCVVASVVSALSVVSISANTIP